MQTQTVFGVAVVHVVGGAGGDEEESAVFYGAFGLEVESEEGFGPIVGEVFVEIVVFFVGDFARIFKPNGFHRVGLFPDAFGDHVRGIVARFFVVSFGFVGAFAVMRMLALHHDGVLDEVAVFFDGFFDDVFVGEVGQMVFEVFGTQFEDDFRAVSVFLGIFDGVIAVARRTERVGFVLSDAFADDGDVVGDDERGIEADAELSDEGSSLFGIFGLFEFFDESFRSGVGDGAQVRDHFVACHAVAVIFDRENFIFFVGRDPDFEIFAFGEFGRIGEGFEASSVEGVGCVGNELAQKYVFARVQALGHHLEKFFCF